MGRGWGRCILGGLRICKSVYSLILEAIFPFYSSNLIESKSFCNTKYLRTARFWSFLIGFSLEVVPGLRLYVSFWKYFFFNLLGVPRR